MKCAICGQRVSTADRNTIRFSTSQPPIRTRTLTTAIAAGYVEAIRTIRGEGEESYYFHRTPCWDGFKKLLDT